MGRASSRKKGRSPDPRPRLTREARDVLWPDEKARAEIMELDSLNPRKLLVRDEQLPALVGAQTGPRYSLEELRASREWLAGTGFIGVSLDDEGNVRYNLLPVSLDPE
jgi:hypothetical protein